MIDLQTVKLTRQHINQIMQLENRVHPPELRFSASVWTRNFQQMEKSNCNFSWGLTDKSALAGYMAAHLGSSYQENSDEPVIEVDDLAIAPEYRDNLFLLIKAFVQELARKKLGNFAIETLATPETCTFLKEHNNVLVKLGYEIVCDYPFYAEDTKRDLVWMRLEPVNGRNDK